MATSEGIDGGSCGGRFHVRLQPVVHHVHAAVEQGVYVHRLRAEIGAMLGSLGGLDALVFAAGVGENSPQVRAHAVEGFAFLGVKLDAAKNAQSPPDTDIAAPDSTVRMLVVHTQEEWEIARESFRVVGGVE
jgi:acetate kinase